MTRMQLCKKCGWEAALSAKFCGGCGALLNMVPRERPDRSPRLNKVETVREMHQRAIRVFISSTFRDMQAERDELVKRTFPQLRKLCEERGVTWGEVDLRWGITDEQAAEGQVLPICLREIERSRPYFIGLLGERYGWIPDEIPAECIEREPWLAEHRERSVTELEILHGVLTNPDMAEHALFYFRDPRYIDTLPPDEQEAYREGPTLEEVQRLGMQEAEQRATERRQKLALLKDRIRSSGFPVKVYANEQELGGLVLQDIRTIVDTRYPEASTPNPLDYEASAHEAYAESRFTVYVERPRYFDRLTAHVLADGPPLVVLGGSGFGKSALVANWARDYRKAHPDILVFTHFIGATPQSTDWAAMVRRIMGELKRRFDLPEEIPTDHNELRQKFANWLSMAAAKAKIVIILDGLNQLEDREGALDLVWLPPKTPSNVRLIFSTLPGRPLDAVKERAWPTFIVEPFNVDERKTLIARYLAEHARTLNTAQLERIATAPQAVNPLYLRTLLDELLVHGDYSTLSDRIEHYLQAPTPKELYERVLHRYEEDYERDRPQLVRDTFSLLWAARYGLSETELMDLLGQGTNPIPRAYLSPLYLAAERSLVTRSGLITFGHEYLRRAVEDLYISTEHEQKKLHLGLADYFERRDFSTRESQELPWQLVEAQEWKRLSTLLSDVDFLDLAWKDNEFEIRSYWKTLSSHSSYDPIKAYQAVLEDPDGYPTLHVHVVSRLLKDIGYPDKALPLLTHLADRYAQSGDFWELAVTLGNHGRMLIDKGEMENAMRTFKAQEHIARELGAENVLQQSLGFQADVLFLTGKLDDAMSLYTSQEEMCQKLGNRHDLQTSLFHQANILFRTGELDSAMRIYKESEHIAREQGDVEDVALCLGAQAEFLFETGDINGALELNKEAEKTFRELGAKEHLLKELGNQARVLFRKGDLDDAMRLHKEEEAIALELGDKRGFQVSLGNQANILITRGDLDGAMELLKEKERLAQELDDKYSLQISLGNQANILITRGDLDGAMELLKEEEELCLALHNPRDLSVCLANQGRILGIRGHTREALRLIERGYSIAVDSGFSRVAAQIKPLGHDLEEASAAVQVKKGAAPKQLQELEDKAGDAATHNRWSDVVQYYDKALLIDPLNAKFWNLKGLALTFLNQPSEALSCYDKALKIDPQYPEAWGNKAITYNNTGKWKDALNCCNQALTLSSKRPFGSVQVEAQVWWTKGCALGQLNDFKEAINCFDTTAELDPQNALARQRTRELRELMSKSGR